MTSYQTTTGSARSSSADSRDHVRCKHCEGTAPRGDGNLPAGWYGLSVGIPVELDGQGRGYLWAGLFCSARCLADAMPEIRKQEEFARMAYDPVLPTGGTR